MHQLFLPSGFRRFACRLARRLAGCGPRQPGWPGGVALAASLVLGSLLSLAGAKPPTFAAARPAPRRPSQAQVAGFFLRAVLRADYAAAYRRLAPEVRRSMSQGYFRGLAWPLAARGRQRGAGIELYKLGLRLDERGAGAQLFVAFAWAADSASARRTPPEWLEATFRDTAARQVLEFRLRHR